MSTRKKYINKNLGCTPSYFWDFLLVHGCHGSGKRLGKNNLFKIRNKSGNFYFKQGNGNSEKVRGKGDHGLGKLRFYEHDICEMPIPSYFNAITLLRILAFVTV